MGFGTEQLPFALYFSTCIMVSDPQRLGGAASSRNQVQRLNTILAGQKSQ